MEEQEKEKMIKKSDIVIDKINNFFEKGIGGTIGTVLSIMSSGILVIKEISSVFKYQDPQRIASYYKISENTPNKGFIIIYYIFICTWGYYTYQKNKENDKKEKICCIIVITLVFTITSWIVLARNMTFEFENKWLFQFFSKNYLVILFLIFVGYLIALTVLFFDLIKEDKNKKIQREICFIPLAFSTIVLFLTLSYLLTFGIENKRGYEIFRQNNILKTILYEKNKKYMVAECKIEDNNIIPSMETLIIDTTTIEEIDLSNIKRRFKIFRKIERVNRN